MFMVSMIHDYDINNYAGYLLQTWAQLRLIGLDVWIHIAHICLWQRPDGAEHETTRSVIHQELLSSFLSLLIRKRLHIEWVKRDLTPPFLARKLDGMISTFAASFDLQRYSSKKVDIPRFFFITVTANYLMRVLFMVKWHFPRSIKAFLSYI